MTLVTDFDISKLSENQILKILHCTNKKFINNRIRGKPDNIYVK